MAGIYIHIPFCKKACHYCNFHFSTSLRNKDGLLEAIKKEIVLQKDYAGTENIETVYFGGGTPSLLQADEINAILDVIAQNYSLSATAEITLEANPDDLDAVSVNALRQTPVNRFSIGIQSFFEEDLKWMNRAHTAAEAETALQLVADAGFSNITGDLIYGFPLLSKQKWEHNIQKLLSFDIPHISAYAMTVEPSTALASFISKGKQPAMDDSQSADQFLILINMLEGSGFEHYEVSNFAKPGKHSKHNSNYWNGSTYIGFGPSAHSFNRTTRQWNVSNNVIYRQSLDKGIIPAEMEILSEIDKLNEYILISLRTRKGTDMDRIDKEFGVTFRSQVEDSFMPFLSEGWLVREQDTFRLTREGMLFADRISGEGMVMSNG